MMFKNLTAVVLGLLISVQAFAATTVTESSFSLKQIDKQLHIATAYGATLSETALLVRHTSLSRWDAVWISSATVLLLGVLKEAVVDKTFSKNDMIANSIGVALNGIVIWAGDLFPSKSGKTRVQKASTADGEALMNGKN